MTSDVGVEASFYGMEPRAARPRIYAGGGDRATLLMTELTMFAGHRRDVGGVGGSLASWPFDCYHDQKRGAAPGFGVPTGAFSVDCLLGRRHGVDDGPVQLRRGIDSHSLNLLHVGKLARTTDIDGR